MSALLDEFFFPLRTVVPGEPIAVRGAWSTSRRKTYAAASQLGTGAGPFVEVVDSAWVGVFESAVALAGIAFLCTARRAWWVKSLPPQANPPVRISWTAAAATRGGRATFTGQFHGVGLPAVPIEGDETTCRLGAENLVTGRPCVVAAAGGSAFVVLLLPGALLKVGRNRLWRLRDDVAPGLPADLGELLTRRRSGELRMP
jgi:hypothetical protein